MYPILGNAFESIFSGPPGPLPYSPLGLVWRALWDGLAPAPPVIFGGACPLLMLLGKHLAGKNTCMAMPYLYSILWQDYMIFLDRELRWELSTREVRRKKKQGLMLF